MTKIRLADRNVVPPKIYDWQVQHFAYLQAETGAKIESGSFIELVGAVKKHRRSNNLPVGLIIEDEIEEQIASKVPQNFTALSDGRPNIQIQKSEWPMWAKAIAVLKTDADQGVGDTVHRVIGESASEAFQNWHRTLFGTSCRCNERRDLWNGQFNYDVA